MQFPSLRLIVVAFLAAGSVVGMKAGAEIPAPKIAAARQFTFTPPAGTAWYLEGTADGEAWTKVGGPFFAGDGPVSYLAPEGRATKFRLTYVDPSKVGNAPMSLGGTTVMMEKAGQPIELVLISANRGFLRLDDMHARGFTYNWRKTAPNEGQAVLSGLDGSYTLLRLKFMDGQVGQWGMEDIPSPQAASLIKNTLDAGAFSFHPGRFKRGVGRAELPLDFAGSSMMFNEGGRLSYARFTGPDTMQFTSTDGTVRTGTYEYDPSTSINGSLSLSVTGTPPLALDLTLTSSGTGKFKEILSPAGEAGGGAPRNGTFTLPEEQLPPDKPDCPPPGLGGLTFTINDSAPCSLSFNSDGSGVQMREVDGALQMIYFNYSYSRTGKNSASVGITFPGAGSDLIEDYQLDFSDDCNGEFSRDTYANGKRAGTSDGTFGSGDLAGRSPLRQ